MLNKSYFMKKNDLFSEKCQFQHMRAWQTLTKIFMLWMRKKASQENLLKCCSGPEFFKMGQIFDLYITDTVNRATYVVSIPIC